tara:strand:+ start:705 stop:830 length:126 start_codon:yes stop_codon:yes gene_type:complete
MTKKITFALIMLLLLFSCGKKGDPVYKESKNQVYLIPLKIE